MMLPGDLLEALDRWFDEGERADLDRACGLAAASPALPIDALLAWVAAARAPAEARRLAEGALRYRLGLPVTPGAPCRKGP